MTPPEPYKAVKHAHAVFRRAGGAMRAAEARRHGVHSRTLRRMVDDGDLMRISRGVYLLPDASSAEPDLAVAAVKVPASVVCLVSALALHGLTTQIPHEVHLAIAPGASAPQLSHPPVRYFRFGGSSMTEGVERHDLDGTSIRVFNPAKTVADCFKFRNRVGLDIAIEALRAFLRRRGATVDALLRFADVDRVRGVMMPYIEAML